MNDNADDRFFQALKQVCDPGQCPDPSVREAVEKACETGAPLDRQAARRAIDGLEPPVRDNLMRLVHLKMATDLSAIWDQFPGKPESRHQN